MKKNLQRFGASVLAAAMVAQSVALPAAAETTKIDSSVAQSVAASAASAASAVQSLPKFTSTADLIKQTAQTLAAQGEVHELEQDDAKPERPFFHFKTNRIGLSKEIIAKRNQQKEKAKRNSFADGCIA